MMGEGINLQRTSWGICSLIPQITALCAINLFKNSHYFNEPLLLSDMKKRKSLRIHKTVGVRHRELICFMNISCGLTATNVILCF